MGTLRETTPFFAMKIFATAIALFAAVFVADLAQAQQSPSWLLVGQESAADGGDRYFVDENSVSRTGNWVQYSALDMYGSPDDNGVAASLIQFTSNCQTAQYRVDHVYAIASSGEVVFSEEPEPQLSQFADGSSGQDILNTVCR